jgi:hypothetical protein
MLVVIWVGWTRRNAIASRAPVGAQRNGSAQSSAVLPVGSTKPWSRWTPGQSAPGAIAGQPTLPVDTLAASSRAQIGFARQERRPVGRRPPPQTS